VAQGEKDVVSMELVEKLRRRRLQSRAAARVLTVETSRSVHRCRVEVQPLDGAPFTSVLQTTAPIVAPALTYVLYNPAAPGRCVVDVARLRANGVRDGRAYHSSGWEGERPQPAPAPRRFGLDDARERLALLDHLNLRRADGTLTEDEFRTEKAAILRTPPQKVG
jgi:hypothetical protein